MNAVSMDNFNFYDKVAEYIVPPWYAPFQGKFSSLKSIAAVYANPASLIIVLSYYLLSTDINVYSFDFYHNKHFTTLFCDNL